MTPAPWSAVGDLLDTIERDLDDAGLWGAFLVRDLATGDELALHAEDVVPIASLVKVPLAVATLDGIGTGRLDGSARLRIEPGNSPVWGPTGVTKFRHHADIAIEDAVYASTSLSDSAAADALFALTPPALVQETIEGFGITGVSVRYTVSDLLETPAERLDVSDGDLAHTLAIEGATAGGGHRVPQLDATRANAGSARALADLLEALWTPSAIPVPVAARVRELLADNVHRQRLAPDFASDATRWSSKTGTLLNLRHEAGVVEHADGSAFVVVALTRSRVAAVHQPDAEAVMGRVARRLRDALRAR